MGLFMNAANAFNRFIDPNYGKSTQTPQQQQNVQSFQAARTSPVYGPYRAQPQTQAYNPPAPVYGPQRPVGPLKPNNMPDTSGGGMPSNPVPQGQNTGSGGNGSGDNGGGYSGPSQEEIARQQYDALTQQLDTEYNSAISMAEGQESTLRGQAGTAEGQVVNEAGKTRTALGQEQAMKEGAWNTTLATAEKGAATEMQQARDLFRQTQQQNIAQLSAAGLSSSSVAEALAEKLGVETARRIAGVTGDLNEVRLNVSKELGRIKSYIGERLTQLQSDEQLQKQQIQQTLMSGLNQINTAKQTAAAEKAARRAGLISQVQSQLASLAQQKQQFEQQLKIWETQKSAALTPLTTNEGLNQILANFQNTLAANPGISQMNIDTRIPVDYGTGKGYLNLSNKKKEDDDGWNNGAPPAWLTAGGY